MIETARMSALLARARANIAVAETRAINQLETIITENKIDQIDFSGTGLNTSDLEAGCDEAEDAAVEIIRDVAATLASAQEATASKGKNVLGVARDDITLNTKQQEFHDLVLAGKDCVLIGAAGTGKTTSVRKTSRSLVDSGRIPKLRLPTKHLVQGAYGAVIIAYTRKAAANIRHAVIDELKANVLTIHKLLEFEPVFYEVIDEESGIARNTMRFEPSRSASNPLPSDLILVLHEESSMEGTELYTLLEAALPHPHQEVFLGDIQQLKPIFGAAILGFKMLELQVIELTEVYRQALGSPIIRLAWKLLSGDAAAFNPKKETVEVWNEVHQRNVSRISVPALRALEDNSPEGVLVIQPWQKTLKEDLACITAIKQFTAWADNGYYNPEEDMILCPFNKAFGTLELNKGIMHHLGRKRGATVHEVIAGFNKHYLAVDDRVLYDKEDAVITAIIKNGTYMGESARPASINLDRWGHYAADLTSEEKEVVNDKENAFSMEALESMLADSAEGITDRVNQGSHSITVRLAADGTSRTFNDAASINSLLGGYVITVHKSQGSEWSKVFFLLHASHATMIQRELLYTGVTRAKHSLHIICETDTLYKGCRSQQIKGNTIKEKAEIFKGKLSKGSGNGDLYSELINKNGGGFDPMKFSTMNNRGRNESVVLEPGESYYEKEQVTETEEHSTCSVVGDWRSISPDAGVISCASTGDVGSTAITQPVAQEAGTAPSDILAKARARLAELKERSKVSSK